MAYYTAAGHLEPVGGDIAAADLVAPFSIHCWIKPNALTAGGLVTKYVSTFNGGQYLLRTNSGSVGLFCLDSGQGGHEALSGPINAGVWQPVGGRMTSGFVLSAFAYGKRGTDNSVGTTNPNNSTPLRIGQRGDNGETYDGVIDKIAMWNDALTDAEFLRLAQGAYAPSVRPGNLTAYWSLRDLNELLSSANKLQFQGGTPTLVPGAFDGSSTTTVAFPFAVTLPVPPVNVETATVYVDIQPSSTDIVSLSSAATVLVDLQPSSVDVSPHTDAATVLLDLFVLGGECFSRFHFTGEGEADPRWDASTVEYRWDTDVETRWAVKIEVQPGCN